MENYILSDIHIEETEKDFFRNKREELIKNNISQILKSKPKRVFLNWDTFHKESIKASWYAAKLFINEIALPLISNGIELHILLGNHERLWNWDSFTFLKWELSNPLIHIYDSITHIDLWDFNAIFIPFMYKWDKNVNTVQKLQEIVNNEIHTLVSTIKNKSPDKPLIIFNHNMMSDLPFDIGKEMNIKFWEIPWVDFVFGWHIHKTEDFSVKDKIKWMYIWSLMKSFVYEEESEWFVWFDISKKNEIIKEYFSNKSYWYEKLEINDTIHFDPKIIKENMVYDINFYYTSQSVDEFFIQTVFSEIAKKNSYIKTHAVINLESDIQLKKAITLLTNEKDILNDFLSDNKISKKEDKERYKEKLDSCMSALWIEESWQVLEAENKSKENMIIKDTKKVNSIASIIDKRYSL